MGIAEELYDGGNLLKLELREGGIMNANGELHKVGNATIQSNIVNTHNSVAGLNFNIITTPLTCDILGTAEIDILGFDMNSINYVWKVLN